jgi:hypothetical protein
MIILVQPLGIGAPSFASFPDYAIRWLLPYFIVPSE